MFYDETERQTVVATRSPHRADDNMVQLVFEQVTVTKVSPQICEENIGMEKQNEATCTSFCC